jgi:peptidoglycan/LPS O-acetylase OafA/YrhL
MAGAVKSSREHRRDIQGLRAAAVLLVIADHAGVERLSGGFVGVDVFFVISGYLITLLLLREAAASGRVRIGEFYARRARRILPAATVVILITMAYAAGHLALSRVQQLRGDAVWSALFAANLHFARLGTDYFAQGREPSPFQHFWSLAVEEQFYLIWPLLLAMLLHVVARGGGTQGTRRRALTWLLAIVIVVSLAWSVLQTEAAPGTAYYSSVSRAWELAVGALVAVQQPRVATWGRWSRHALGIAGLVAVATAAVIYDAGSAFPGWRALLPVLGTAALVAAGVAGPSGASRMLTFAPLPWLGDMSYSLYLWHWPVLILGASHSDLLTGARGTVLLLVATLLAALATYHLVENPLRRTRLLRPGRRSLVLWPLALGSVLIGVTGAERQAATMFEERLAGGIGQPPVTTPPEPSTEPPLPHGRGSPTARAAGGPSLVDRLTDALRLADSGAPVPFPLTNLPRAREHDAFPLPPDCVVDPAETSTEVCPVGQREATRTMVVLGDSQAGQWLPALDSLGSRDGLRILPLIKLGCPPFDVPVVDGARADFWQCTAFREWAAAYIADTRPQIVLVASEATSYRLRPGPGLDLAETWAAGVESTLNRLHRLGVPVVVLADTPDLAFDPVDCLTDPDARLDDCVGAPHPGLAAANAITRAVAGRTGAGYVDTVGLLCVQERCPVVVGRTMTFMDYSHVSPAWSVALADDLRRLYAMALRGLKDNPHDP